MKKFQLKTLLAVTTALLVLASCSKDKVVPTPDATYGPGVFVLNQGGINKSNSTLSFYNYLTKATVPDAFLAANGRSIGDTGNDAKIYGSKMYIVVNYSSTIEIVNAKTLKSIDQIKMVNNSTNRQPRSIVFNKNKAFISSYDGTVAVLDTTTLAIEKYINVGRNPEQMVIANGKLYVANSGGLDYENPDNTVSVIDLNTLSETIKITVPSNPVNISADAYGDVYVISYGTYPSTPKLTIINNVTDAVKVTNDIDAGYFASFLVNGDVAYYITDAGKIKVYDVKKETIISESFVTDDTAITVPYALAVDASNGDLYVTDAKDYTNNGLLFAFNKNGKIKFSAPAGINPGTIVLVK